MIRKLVAILDRLFGVREPHKAFLVRRLPEGKLNFSFCFGGMAFTAFMLSVLTGLFLSVYYVPSEADAYLSITKITDEVFMGWLVRGLHKWSASVLVTLLVLHTARVVIYGAYSPPRELNWLAGAASLVLVLASGFTGYLLPWDQKAYWATVVGTSMAKTVPFLGDYILVFLRGGREVGGSTLIRFYSLHVVWLPLAMIFILWAHFHMIKRLGIKGGL